MARHSDETAETTADETTDQSDEQAVEKKSRLPRPTISKDAVNRVRTRLAQVVWIVCVVCALILALGALCIALKANPTNNLVRFILDTANKLDFGIFERGRNGVYHAAGATHAARTKNAIVNWGLAALVWLVGGQIVSRIIKP
ncbi:MAG: hypothetical protein WAV00_10110 [Nocardioides sp.]